MNISLKKLGTAGAAILVGTLVLVSCKRTYDTPPPISAPGITANISIKDLKAMDTAPYSVVHITQDLVIRGVVNMDDKSGNYYQQISMQDSTGGIILRLAGSNLNTSYPVGRELFVKVKDLYIGEYGGMLQLGGGADSINGGVTMLSPVLQDQHIYKGALNQPLTAKVVNLANLTTNRQDPYANTLIRVEGYEFQASDTAKNYADVGAAGNRIAKGCGLPTSSNLTVRTSDFSNFATRPIPNGNGSITGIYSFFGSTKQLSLRDTNDVRLYGPRCGGTGPGPGPVTSNPTFTLTGTSPYTIDFNSLASGLPDGVRVGMSNTAAAVDTNDAFVATPTPWATSTANFRNVASYTGASQGADDATQAGYTNRALGIRQTSSVGDPGAGVVLILANTTGKTLTQLSFLLQSLDAGSTRTTAWVVEYAVGDPVPTSFTALAPTGTLTTGGGTFTNNLITVPLPAALSNQTQKVWIRIWAKNGTTGSNNRPTSGIDDVKITWN